MASAAQLREEKLKEYRMRQVLATQKQKEFCILPAQSPNENSKIPKIGNIISGTREKLLKEVYDVGSEEDEENVLSKRLINNQTITEEEVSDKDNVMIATLKRKSVSDENQCGPSTRKKTIEEDVKNQEPRILFRDSGDAERIPENTIDYKKLAKEIGDVLVLRNLDLNCTSGTGLKVGLSVMKRIVDFGHQEILEDSGAEALEVFGRMGLNMAEFTTGGSFLVNKIDLLQSSRNKTEKMLASANRLIEEKEEEIYKLGQQFSNVECKVEDVKRDMKKLEEKETSFMSRIAELETIVAKYEQEENEWCEDRNAWFSEKNELVADAEAARKTSWDEFVEQYEKSSQFYKRLNEKTLGCYEQGMYHALRMAAASNIQGITAETLAHWAKSVPYGVEGRRGHMIVPYSRKEIEELRAYDLKNGMPECNLPKPIEANVKVLMGISGDEIENMVDEVLPPS